MRFGSIFGKQENEKAEESKVEESTPPPAPVKVEAPAPAPTPAPAPRLTQGLNPLESIPTETVPTLAATVAPTPAPPSAPKPEPAPSTPRQVPDPVSLKQIVEKAVLDSEGTKLETVRLGGMETAPLMMAGKTLNFSALYENVALPAPPFSAEQMLEMLNELPGTRELQRGMVDVFLSRVGKMNNTTQETIVADTSRKMTTLANFSQEYEKKTNERVAKAESEIADLLAQVEAKRQAVQAAKERLATVQDICVGETDRLDTVLEFFDTDVPEVVHQVFGQTKEGKASKAAARFTPKVAKVTAAVKPATPVTPVVPPKVEVKGEVKAEAKPEVAPTSVTTFTTSSPEKAEKAEKTEKTDDEKLLATLTAMPTKQ